MVMVVMRRGIVIIIIAFLIEEVGIDRLLEDLAQLLFV